MTKSCKSVWQINLTAQDTSLPLSLQFTASEKLQKNPIASCLPIISKVSRQKHGIHQTPALHFVHLAERSALTLPADREAIYSSLRPASLPLARELTVATQRSQRSAVLTGSRCFPRTEFLTRLPSGHNESSVWRPMTAALPRETTDTTDRTRQQAFNI